MPEERAPTQESRIEDRLIRLGEGQQALREDVALLRGIAEQMDRRLTNLEALQRWGMGLWAAVMLAVIGLYFKG